MLYVYLVLLFVVLMLQILWTLYNYTKISKLMMRSKLEASDQCKFLLTMWSIPLIEKWVVVDLVLPSDAHDSHVQLITTCRNICWHPQAFARIWWGAMQAWAEHFHIHWGFQVPTALGMSSRAEKWLACWSLMNTPIFVSGCRNTAGLSSALFAGDPRVATPTSLK